MRRLLLLAAFAALLAGCAPAAAAPTPTPVIPTATPVPPTATLLPSPTATPTATLRPIEAWAAFLRAYAPDAAVSADGESVTLTLPSGERLQLADVSAEKRTMEPQNWVENYNGGQVLLEGQDEQGRLWRVVERNGERLLMYRQQTPIRMDAFPYWWWGGGPEGKAEIKLPGNGQLEWLKISRTDQKDDQGHWIWQDEQGQPVELSDLGYQYTEKILPHQGKPVPTEMKLPVVVLTNWQVESLEANDGHEYVVREGKLLIDGQEAAVPETKSQVPPESLMFNSKDGRWYVGWNGIALWKVENGQVVKYDRPVWMTHMYKVVHGGTWSEELKRWQHDPKVVGELDYGLWGGKYHYQVGGSKVSLNGMIGGVYGERWEKTVFIMPGFVVKTEESDVGMGLAVRYPQAFNDFVDVFVGFTFDRPSGRYWLVAKDGEVLEGHQQNDTAEALRDYLHEHLPLPILATKGDGGVGYMSTRRYDGTVAVSREEAERLHEQLEDEILEGYLSKDQQAFLGIGQIMVLPAEVFGQ